VRTKILKNTFFLSGSQIIARTIGFFYFIYLARALSLNEFGALTWVLAFVYNFYPLADFGLERVVLKHIPRQPERAKHYLDRLFPLRLFLGLASILISLLLALAIGISFKKLELIFVFSLTIVPYNLVYLLAAFENAREKMITYAKATVWSSIFSALFGSIFIQLGFGLGWILLGYFLSNLVVLIWLFFNGKKLNLEIGWKIDLKFWKKIIRESWVFGLLLVIAVFYLRISLVLVGRLLGDYWAGIYGSASKFIEAGILIPQGLALALFPASSRLMISDKKKLKQIYQKTWLSLFLISVPIGLTMFYLGEKLMVFVYGQNYSPAGPVFSLFGLLLVFFFVNALPGNIIQNSKKVKKFLPFAIGNFLVALISGLVLIPRLGVIGGVWAMIIGETYGLIVNNLFVFKILNH